jgi:hypothetical protein
MSLTPVKDFCSCWQPVLRHQSPCSRFQPTDIEIHAEDARVGVCHDMQVVEVHLTGIAALRMAEPQALRADAAIVARLSREQRKHFIEAVNVMSGS